MRLIYGVLMVNYHSNLFYNKQKKRSKIQTNFAAKNGHYPIFKLTYEIHYKSRKIVWADLVTIEKVSDWMLSIQSDSHENYH